MIMLRSLKEISGFRIHAMDGDIGSVDDFFFEDNTWHIRYIVVDTGRWLPGRRVLLSPLAVGLPLWEKRKLPTDLTMQKVKDSPDINTDQPVSRQQEADLHAYYMWPPYWGANFGMIGNYPLPSVIPPESSEIEEKTEEMSGEKMGEEKAGEVRHGDPHLRGMREIFDYTVEGLDGDVGDVDDFIVDDCNWSLRYLVVDTGNWLPGKKVLVATRMIQRIDRNMATVHVDLHKQAIKTCPQYHPDQPIGDQYEQIIKSHYSQAK
jgi:hypothetical protein